MKFYMCIILMSSMLSSHAELRLQIQRADKKAAKTAIALVVTQQQEVLQQVAQRIQKDFEKSGQCSVTMHYAALPQKKHDIENYYAVGYQFVLFLDLTDGGNSITGRLYDALDSMMLEGKKWQRREPLIAWADKIARDMWYRLMNNNGSFGSQIAYVKRTKNQRGQQVTQLCIRKWDDAQERVLLSNTSILVAPAWKCDGELIFCSQFTRRNVRLIAVDLSGASWVALDRDGTTVGATSALGSSDVVYCHSGEIWKCSYEPKRKRSLHTLLVRDNGMCASPLLLATGGIIYCAGGKIKQWDPHSGTSTVLTEQGYCAGPTYHAPTHRVAFSKKIDKTMQLCVLDIKTGHLTPLTFDDGDKIDSSWSPCGSYLAYCFTKGKVSEIRVLNCITGVQTRISPEKEFCSCPAWSPLIDS